MIIDFIHSPASWICQSICHNPTHPWVAFPCASVKTLITLSWPLDWWSGYSAHLHCCFRTNLKQLYPCFSLAQCTFGYVNRPKSLLWWYFQLDYEQKKQDSALLYLAKSKMFWTCSKMGFQQYPLASLDTFGEAQIWSPVYIWVPNPIKRYCW